VLAKRALVATDPGSVEKLSPVSVRSLAVQGGPAAAAEVCGSCGTPGRGCVSPLTGWWGGAPEEVLRNFSQSLRWLLAGICADDVLR